MKIENALGHDSFVPSSMGFELVPEGGQTERLAKATQGELKPQASSR